jgi:glucose/arabinose dehydrogenase
VQLIDTVGRRLLHELPARPTGVFVAPSGALLVVEPDGLRILEPATGGELRGLRW